jgi:hypothetical protein
MDHTSYHAAEAAGREARMVQTFEVIVRGRLSVELAHALDGFTVAFRESGVTSIVGPVIDQPRLLALLGAFDDLHIEVISVNPVAEPESPEQGDDERSTPH